MAGIGLDYFGRRYYDPEIGVFSASDPLEQDWNVYGYCGADPINLIDPSGASWIMALDILLGGAISVTAGAMAVTPGLGDYGYKIQSQVMPISFKLNYGTDNIGFDVSTQVIPGLYSVHGGASYYSNYYGTGISGWGSRYGSSWTLGPATYSGTHFSGMGIDQTTNSISMDLGSIVGVPVSGIYGTYENDGAWGWLGQNMPLVPHVTAGDQGDKYRTAAAALDIGPVQVGMNLFTGDPGPATSRENVKYGPGNGPNGTYYANNGTSPNKYRAGALWVGAGGMRFGRNSEGIRNNIQNKMIHDAVGAPHFAVLDKSEWYWYFGTGTGGTLW